MIVCLCHGVSEKALEKIIDEGADCLKAVERALHEPDTDRIRRGIEKAKASSWEATVSEMQRLIRAAVTPKDRRSA